MKSVYGQWFQAWSPKLKQPSDDLQKKSSKTVRTKQNRPRRRRAQKTAPKPEADGDASSDKRGVGGFASTAWHSSAKSVYGQCPPFGQEGHAGERKLKQPFFGRQLEPKRGDGGPFPQLIPKTNDRFSRWSCVACWTGRVCLWAVPPPRDWALEEGDRKLKQPLSVDGVGLVRNGGRDDPTWVTCGANLAEHCVTSGSSSPQK